MRNQQGFTLIELVVVIIILGILAATAAPKFLDLSSDAKTSATKGLKGAVQTAMVLAYAKHRTAGLSASGATAGVDQYITDCASLVAYLEGGAWPSTSPATSCTGGKITYVDGTTAAAALTAETNTSAAVLNP